MAKGGNAQISPALVVVFSLMVSTTVFSARTRVNSHDLERLKANTTEEILPLIALIPIIIASVAAGAAGAAVTTVTLMNYFNSSDAPQKFSYIHLPKAEACKADPTSIGNFFSKATNRSSDPRKCSICRSITSSLSGLEESAGFSSWFSWAPDMELVNASCSNLSTTVPELQSECRDLAESLLTEVTDLHKYVKTLAGATELGARFASRASCEDLQCCPQDPFVAEVVAGAAAESLQSPEDVETIERYGVVGGMLGSPEARANLEEHLAYLQIRKISFFNQHILTDDEQCKWDYMHAKCHNSDVCHYDFHLGDLLLDDSCRLKPSAKAPPQSDSDCIWDFSVNKCHKEEFCSRQCKASDASLDDCCRLREPLALTTGATEPTCGAYCATEGCAWTSVWSCPWAASDGTAGRAGNDNSTGYFCCCEDVIPSAPICGHLSEVNGGSKTEEGNCDNPEDLALMAAPDTPGHLQNISKDSFSIWRMQINATRAFSETVTLGFSKKCASCFVDLFVCGTVHCYTQLAVEKHLGKPTEAARACMQHKCAPDLLSCAGVEASDMPRGPRQDMPLN